MNILDTRTVLFSSVITSAICAGVIASLWRQNRRRSPELGYWLADFSLQFLSILFIALRGVLPDVVSVLPGVPFSLAGALLMFIGLEQYVGKPGARRYNFGLLAVFTLVHAYFTYGLPSLPARNINFSLGLLVFCAQCAWLLWRRVDVNVRPDTKAAGVIFGVYGLISLLRIFADLLTPRNNDLFTSGLYDTLAILIYQMLLIGLTFTLFLMVNRRLVTALESDITERKRAEEALRQSEEKFSTAFQTSPYAITITRADDGQFIEINDTFTLMTGFTRAEALADSSVGLKLWTNAEDRQRVVDALRAGRAVMGQEYAFQKKGGEVITGLFSAQLIQLSQGLCILSSINNISERKQAEQQIESLARFPAENPNSVLRLQPDGVILYANAASQVLLQEWGCSMGEAVPPDLRAAVAAVFAERISQYMDVESAGRVWSFFITPIVEAGYINLYGRDVTDRKQAEETLLESERRLREAQEMAHLGFWLWDIQTGAVEWSEEVFKIFGLDPQEFTPRIDSILAMSPWAEDHQRDQELIKRAIETHSPGSYEQKFLRPDQSIGHYYSTFQGNYDEQGDLHSIVGTVLDITERKQAEEALRLSETNYRTLMEQASDGIFIADANGNYTDVNSQGCAMLGFAREEILQLNLKDVLLPEDIAVIPVRMIELHAGQVILSERRMRRKDGSIFSAEISGKRLADDRLQGIVRDITERKRAEEEIRQRAEEIRTLMEVTPVAIWVASDPQCLHITGNQAGNQFYEAVGEENVSAGSTGVRRFFRDGRELAADELTMQEAARLGQDIRNSELDVLLPSGRWMTIWGNATPLRDAAGNVRGCIGAFMDITDRKRMEEALRQTNEQLEQRVAERTAELSDLYNHAPCGYHSLDANGVFVRINDTELQWLGYTREEVIGRLAATDLFTPASVETFNQNFPVFKTRGWLRDLELDMVRKDGSILSILLNATLMVDQDGRYLMSRSTMIDHTDRKQAESQREAALEAMRVSQAQLAASNKELEAFAYSVSHDLRAPLRAIDGFSRILLEDYADRFDAEGQRLFAVVRSNAQKMDHLITDLLALSRITRSEMVLSHIDMTTLVHAVYEDIVLPEVQAQFELSIAPLPEANGDPALLRQVWSNLLSNAIKYTLPRSVRRIEVGGYRQGDEYIYFVKDTGVGFNPAYTHKLFGVFQRLHKAEEFEGTGVGLAIVQRIILRHGGRVWAEGQVNAGATFYFAVPYTEADDESSP